MDTLKHLQEHLKGKLVILGIGNTMRGDDGVGSLLASRIRGKVPFCVFDAGVAPENYLEKVIREKPDNILFIDAVDFGARPGEFRILESGELKTANLFATHNASLNLAINYLQSSLKVDIIILIIQPESFTLGEKLSPQVESTLGELEKWFYEQAKSKG